MFGLFKSSKKELETSLEKTKTGFLSKISKVFLGKTKVDAELLDELEEALIAADVGTDTTLSIIKKLEEKASQEKYSSQAELTALLKETISSLLDSSVSQNFENIKSKDWAKPYVILVVGVNGVGKTTTIGKLAAQYKKNGHKVILGAGDTFRAAAVDQIKLWGDKNDIEVVSNGMNTDPASVAFDAVKRAKEVNADVVIVDTAGRLHTKLNLMNELTKIKKVMEKVIPEAPHEVMLVLDGSTGQNAIIQAREFTKATQVNSLAVTKLDGTAKGGVVIGISHQFKIPVKYIGTGEKQDDIQVFDKNAFIDTIFSF